MGSVVRDVPFGGPRPKPLPASEPIRIDGVARERAEGAISEIATATGKIEAYLAWLAGFVEPRSPGAAVVRSAGLKAEELREEIGPLRGAIRDIPGMDGGDAA